MVFPRNSKDRKVEIEDYYAIKLKSLWQGLKTEHVAFWALCVYFLFEYVRPQSIYPAIDVLPWTLLTIIIATVAAFRDPSAKWRSNFANKLIIALFVVIILSSIFAFRPAASWANINLFINWVLVYFLVINVINTEKRLFIFILAFLLFNFKMSQHGFFSWMQRGFAFTNWGLVGTPGWFSNSGEFAVTMLVYVPLATAFILALRSRWGRIKRWIFYMMPFTGVMSIIGASSRGSQLGLAVIGLWLLLKWKQRFRAIIALGVITLVLYHLLPQEQIIRLSEMGKDPNSLQRLAYWKYGIQLMNEHPFLGVGYFNWFENLMFKFPNGFGPVGLLEEPHNIFIQAGTEMGYTGLVIFVAMIITMVMLNISTRKKARQSGNQFLYYLSLGLDGGLIGYLVGGYFVSIFYYPFFWVQLSLVVATYLIAGDISNHCRKSDPALPMTRESERGV